MDYSQKHAEICEEISGELEDIARWLSGGELSPGQFRLLLNTLEKKKLERFRMKLTSAISIDGVVHFSLRFAETDELCATMDVDPISGKLTTRLAYPAPCCSGPKASSPNAASASHDPLDADEPTPPALNGYDIGDRTDVK